MKTIGIIGGGFSGTMTAFQLIEKSIGSYEIILINERNTLNKGVAYNAYSDKHLLNVIAAKMSAFPDQPSHYLDWVMLKEGYVDKDRSLIANSFLPRCLYGEYLGDIWKMAERNATSKSIKLTVIDSNVVDLDVSGKSVSLILADNMELNVDYCVIATGNHIPANPNIPNTGFYNSKNYYQNPWDIESVKNLMSDSAVLIIGNGLTMVDTVFGLLEQGFDGRMYSISPNGFNIVQHRHNGLKYPKLADGSMDALSLYDWVKWVNRYKKALAGYGISVEPIIDFLRPHTQKIWKSLSDWEKETFMIRLRHLWNIARHRIPAQSHDKIQQLRLDGKLHTIAGAIIDIEEADGKIEVKYFDKKENALITIIVSRVINCTGPETDLMKLSDANFLKKCLLKGIIAQDKLKLGINTDTTTFQIANTDGKLQSNLFAVGPNLKGELWESTAVNELRDQAVRLADELIARQLLHHPTSGN